MSEIRIEDRKGDFIRGRLGDLQVDLLLTDNELFDQVRRDIRFDNDLPNVKSLARAWKASCC